MERVLPWTGWTMGLHMYSNACCGEWRLTDRYDETSRDQKWGIDIISGTFWKSLAQNCTLLIPWIIIALKYYLLKIGLRPASYDRGGAQIENNQWGIKNVTRRRAGSRATWREVYRVSLHIPACRSNCTQKLFGTSTRKCSSRTVECPWYLTSVLSH